MLLQLKKKYMNDNQFEDKTDWTKTGHNEHTIHHSITTEIMIIIELIIDLTK